MDLGLAIPVSLGKGGIDGWFLEQGGNTRNVSRSEENKYIWHVNVELQTLIDFVIVCQDFSFFLLFCIYYLNCLLLPLLLLVFLLFVRKCSLCFYFFL